jgi:hypothetical protein
MIISHTHRFLFMKSIKTAGTSVEAALSQYCGGDDIVTPLNDFSFNRDESGAAVHRAMNAERLPWWDKEIGQHVDAPTMKAHLPDEIWRSYFKFSIARNPWDRTVSNFAWLTRNDATMKPRKRFYHRLGVPFDERRELRTLFGRFVRRNPQTNDRFYVIDGELCVDFVIRYESLSQDLDTVCRRLGIPPPNLPRLKAGIRKGADHYSQYYDDETRDFVAELHRNDIRLFGYRFEQA